MHLSEKEDKNKFNFYSSNKNQNKDNIKNELLNAIENNEFELYLQPQFDKNELLYGAEALIRWNHPEKGFILPDKFINSAIKSGLIDKIDLWVIENALSVFKKWQLSSYNPGVLSCNVTVYQLEKDTFFEEIKSLINKYNFNTEFLCLEITEESIMTNPEKSVKTLNKLVDMGISISIDDFGTGYSSLAYLKKLPVSKLKIDQSFIYDIPYNRDDVIITKAIINLGKNLDLEVVAEGVKNKIQRQFVIDKGCDYIQGEYYSMPVSIKNFYNNFLIKDNL